MIAIFAILMALTLAGVQRVREASHKTSCANNLRQIGIAAQSYHDTHGTLPPGVSHLNGADPTPFMTWLTRLLPYIEQQALWDQSLVAFGKSKFFLLPVHAQILGHTVKLFVCPSDSRVLSPVDRAPFRLAFTSYLGSEGTNQTTRDGLFFLDSRVRLAEITDGTSHTVAAGERPPSTDLIFGWWYAGWGQAKDGSADSVLGAAEIPTHRAFQECPAGDVGFGPGRYTNQCDALHFWSPHSGGCPFLFADGSVRYLSYSARSVLPALTTRAGHE
ncbi:MAG: DUF1559 domain-containing protein, partial [Gemmataceae bacterium]